MVFKHFLILSFVAAFLITIQCNPDQSRLELGYTGFGTLDVKLVLKDAVTNSLNLTGNSDRYCGHGAWIQYSAATYTGTAYATSAINGSCITTTARQIRSARPVGAKNNIYASVLTVFPQPGYLSSPEYITSSQTIRNITALSAALTGRYTVTLYQEEQYGGRGICLTKSSDVLALFIPNMNEYTGGLSTFKSILFEDSCGLSSEKAPITVLYVGDDSSRH